MVVLGKGSRVGGDGGGGDEIFGRADKMKLKEKEREREIYKKEKRRDQEEILKRQIT